MKIVILDKIGLLPADEEKLQTLGDVTLHQDTPKTPEQIVSRAKDADLVTAYRIDITADILKQLPKLKYIVIPAVGFERVDIEQAAAQGIKVLNCPTQNTTAVASFTIAIILALTRRIVEARDSLKSGHWERNLYKGIELPGRTLGLIGYGRIGKEVAAIAEKLGMKVIFVNKKSTDADIDNLIKVSDVVSLHVPLNSSTEKMLDEHRLKLMKKGSFLINTARGAEVDQTALIALLKNGHLAGAALDVYANEPTNGHVSEEILELANMSNVIATPHTGFNTKERDARLGVEIIKDIESCINGAMVNVVN